MNMHVQKARRKCEFCNQQLTTKTLNIVVYPLLLIKLGLEPASRYACDNCFITQQQTVDQIERNKWIVPYLKGSNT